MPLKAKSCGKGALIGGIVYFVAGTIIGIIAVVAVIRVGLPYFWG
jgi:hypothetical protein